MLWKQLDKYKNYGSKNWKDEDHLDKYGVNIVWVEFFDLISNLFRSNGSVCVFFLHFCWYCSFNLYSILRRRKISQPPNPSHCAGCIPAGAHLHTVGLVHPQVKKKKKKKQIQNQETLQPLAWLAFPPFPGEEPSTGAELEVTNTSSFLVTEAEPIQEADSLACLVRAEQSRLTVELHRQL